MIPIPNMVNLIPSPGLPGTGIGPINIPVGIGVILTAFVLIGLIAVGLEALHRRIERTPPDRPATRADLTLAHASRH